MKKKYLCGISVDTQFGPLYLLNEKLSEWYEHTEKVKHNGKDTGAKKHLKKKNRKYFALKRKERTK